MMSHDAAFNFGMEKETKSSAPEQKKKAARSFPSIKNVLRRYRSKITVPITRLSENSGSSGEDTSCTKSEAPSESVDLSNPLLAAEDTAEPRLVMCKDTDTAEPREVSRPSPTRESRRAAFQARKGGSFVIDARSGSIERSSTPSMTERQRSKGKESDCESYGGSQCSSSGYDLRDTAERRRIPSRSSWQSDRPVSPEQLRRPESPKQGDSSPSSPLVVDGSSGPSPKSRRAAFRNANADCKGSFVIDARAGSILFNNPMSFGKESEKARSEHSDQESPGSAKCSSIKRVLKSEDDKPFSPARPTAASVQRAAFFNASKECRGTFVIDARAGSVLMTPLGCVQPTECDEFPALEPLRPRDLAAQELSGASESRVPDEGRNARRDEKEERKDETKEDEEEKGDRRDDGILKPTGGKPEAYRHQLSQESVPEEAEFSGDTISLDRIKRKSDIHSEKRSRCESRISVSSDSDEFRQAIREAQARIHANNPDHPPDEVTMSKFLDAFSRWTDSSLKKAVRLISEVYQKYSA